MNSPEIANEVVTKAMLAWLDIPEFYAVGGTASDIVVEYLRNSGALAGLGPMAGQLLEPIVQLSCAVAMACLVNAPPDLAAAINVEGPLGLAILWAEEG